MPSPWEITKGNSSGLRVACVIIILSEIGEPSSALLSVLASCGTGWVIWAGGVLVTLGVCRYLDALVIGRLLSGER